jgi:putative DNA primase/helicase
VLAQLGIPQERLRKKAGPCPACGGEDRFTFDNRHRRGDFYCRQCGAGSGFDLLMRVHGWDFSEARRRVIEAASLEPSVTTIAPSVRPPMVGSTAEAIAEPTRRVLRLMRECCAVQDCADALAYLEHRRLWPLPEGCTLRAHPNAEYWHDGARIGRFPALVAAVRDINDELVSLHLTYLQAGRKLATHEPRKLLSALTGREGCAVRLLPAGDTLGLGEGLETCISAATINGVPTWAALSAAVLAKFEPPASVKRLLVFADCDRSGLIAAAQLMQRLQGRIAFELCLPPAGAKDWNEVIR